MPASRKAKRAGGRGLVDNFGFNHHDQWEWHIYTDDLHIESLLFYKTKSAATRAMNNAARRLGIQLKGDK